MFICRNSSNITNLKPKYFLFCDIVWYSCFYKTYNITFVWKVRILSFWTSYCLDGCFDKNRRANATYRICEEMMVKRDGKTSSGKHHCLTVRRALLNQYWWLMSAQEQSQRAIPKDYSVRAIHIRINHSQEKRVFGKQPKHLRKYTILGGKLLANREESWHVHDLSVFSNNRL